VENPRPATRIVTRFAPSPTGRLHLGHAYSALLAHDFARERGGAFLLRIEDIDPGRTREQHVAGIAEDLAWLGLSWDGEVVRQSQRLPLYAAALDRLKARNLIYPCFCTRAEIAREIAASASAPHGPDGALYPGTCRGLSEAEREARVARGDPHAWRLDMSLALRLAAPLSSPGFPGEGDHLKNGGGASSSHERSSPDNFTRRREDAKGRASVSPVIARGASPAAIQQPGELDRFAPLAMTSGEPFAPSRLRVKQSSPGEDGEECLRWTDHGTQISATPEIFGDVILARKDAPTSYHLAVTVDDAAQGVTDVIRGEDLLPSTHVHRLLQVLLGLPTPRYHHHVLLTDAAGKRLAKRDNAPTLGDLRAAGADPAALVENLRRRILPDGILTQKA
jgi:glutamyl-Q tRNA(Asp) synthetase